MSVGSVVGGSQPASAINVQGTQDSNSLERKVEQLKDQIEQVKKNEKLSQEEKDKRITNIETQVVQLEQQKGRESSQVSSVELKKRFDTYEAQPQQPSTGLYRVAHDAEGRQSIQVEQSLETAQEQPDAKPQTEGEKPTIVKTTGNTDKVDWEIEKLKQTQAQLEQKIAAAKKPEDKEALESQLAQVKAELKLKDNDTYRRQHMEITEQKVVSRIGE